MNITITLGKKNYRVLTNEAISLAIPLQFNGKQPNHFGVNDAHAKTVKAGDFIGDTQQGGSCNVSTVTLTPHCNGTHTESVSHITSPLIAVGELAIDLLPATVISVRAESGNQSPDHYTPELQASDKVISKHSLVAELSSIDSEMLKALIIRTLPNHFDKKFQQYGSGSEQVEPPFFTHQAIQYLIDKGVEHLLVDIPSIDKMYDEGMLSNHHYFWNVEQLSHQLNDDSAVNKTITEMIYVPDEVLDGHYLLSLNIARFQLDAAPSRPIIYPIDHINT